jgi:hypothetical protein
MFKEQFQVGDAMLTKVIWFASPFKKSIHPGLSRWACRPQVGLPTEGGPFRRKKEKIL